MRNESLSFGSSPPFFFLLEFLKFSFIRANLGLIVLCFLIYWLRTLCFSFTPKLYFFANSSTTACASCFSEQDFSNLNICLEFLGESMSSWFDFEISDFLLATSFHFLNLSALPCAAATESKLLSAGV